MDAFKVLDAVAVPLDQPNIDTDQIVPARFLGIARDEQARYMFYDLRRDKEGGLLPDFVLNEKVYADAQIVVASTNFGCGSSRECAVTVMVDNGFKAFIASSFGDIFFNNCFQNGVLPIRLNAERVEALRAMLHKSPGAHIKIDLPAQTVTGPDGQVDHFEIDSFRKDCLLRGVDEINLTRSYEAEISDFERRHDERMGWLNQA